MTPCANCFKRTYMKVVDLIEAKDIIQVTKQCVCCGRQYNYLEYDYSFILASGIKCGISIFSKQFSRRIYYFRSQVKKNAHLSVMIKSGGVA